MKLLFLTLMSIMALGLSVYSGGENKVRVQYILLGNSLDLSRWYFESRLEVGFHF